MDPLQASDGWSLAGALGALLITSYFGYLAVKVKSSSDKKDEDVKPVLEKVEQAVNLQPAVDALSARVVACEAELAEYRPIAKFKYPLALNTIASFRQAHPSSTVFIPHQIQEDL
ncbi:hypothetical protein HMPREF0290_0858 [Corynebacterium efficiens YS-314]|uniref:Uncharacterized protein n=1 Tax=Corynebacterium efficiens (strain DSM 44549 / YS-314 / AJ 12310 / JCM 11189 / NBRC 100395) TaxID=196164 RepID=Q8FR97_COREF|nr:hypothetical protein [Corynebacterium efficiens]EEW50410.1 hypothetical protein HMPREF0290_0858 [Corynebacterium efficiens YS-314]BAC17674.1 hypothetical protein [Corynebacterium efficiens YS-314]